MDKEIIIEEYKNLWNYYIETLNNRKNMLDWYFKIVGLPASILGFASQLIPLINSDKSKVSIPDNFFGLIFLTIFLCGVGLFIAYSKESGNSLFYLKSIDNARKHLNTKYTFTDSDFKLNLYEPLYSYWKCIKGITFWRISPVVIINSFLFSLFFKLICCIEFNLVCILIPFCVSIVAHVFLYPVLFKSGMKKEEGEK